MRSISQAENQQSAENEKHLTVSLSTSTGVHMMMRSQINDKVAKETLTYSTEYRQPSYVHHFHRL